jgi:nitroreductase
MDAIENIMKRRSVRKFNKNQLVPESVVEQILRAAMNAPSANNKQPWDFLVIDDRTILDQIPNIMPNAAMCNEAPLAIVICLEQSRDKSPDYWQQDLAAATENILLAVHALGLGAVWVGAYPNQQKMAGLRKTFNLPEEVTPFSLIPIGATSVNQDDAKRFKSERVHRNKW